MTRIYDVTNIDTGRTEQLTERQARKTFGRDEWLEIKAGYLPHLAVMEVEPSIAVMDRLFTISRR